MSKLTTGTIARSRREELGFTRAQLASRAGISISTIDRLELHDKVPGAQNLVRLAAELQISLDELLRSETLIHSADEITA